MILRLLPVALTFGAMWGLWVLYGNLGFLRGTPLWELRYVVFVIAGFLGLGALEWALAWLRKRLSAK